MVGQVRLGEADVRRDGREAAIERQAELVVRVGGLWRVEEVDGAMLEALIDRQDRQPAAGAVQK